MSTTSLIEPRTRLNRARREPAPHSFTRTRGARSTSLLITALAVEAQRHDIDNRLLAVLSELFDDSSHTRDSKRGQLLVEQRIALEAERDDLDARSALLRAHLRPRDREVVEHVREQNAVDLACAALDERLRPAVELILGSPLRDASA